jgi:hypothetical protein
MSDTPSETAGSRDGSGPGGDHNIEFSYGEHLNSRSHWPFNDLQFSRLLCLRSHVDDGERVPLVHILTNPLRFGLLKDLAAVE